MNLQQLIERYISYRQALGEKFSGGAAILRAFVRTVGSQADIGSVRAEQIAAFLAGARPITNYWHNKYRALFGFYSFAKSRGHVTEVPLPAKPPKQLPPFVPYIYSREELRRLLDAAGCYQRGESALDPITFRTILLLLYGTGLRDGEVIRLNRADVDLDNSLLTVRLTKFHKSRLVPFGPQVCQILTEYANSRTAPVVRPGEETPFFTTRKGTRIVLNTLQAHFRRVRAQSGIRRTDGARYQPRLHDLRHNADCRIMPMETLGIWFFGPFPRPLDSPLAKTTRHNPDILSFCGHPISPKREDTCSSNSLQMYLHADLRLKEEALSTMTPLDVQPGRFRPDDEPLAFLEGL